MFPLHVKGIYRQQYAQEAHENPGYSFPPRGGHSQDGRRHRSLAWLETRIHTQRVRLRHTAATWLRHSVPRRRGGVRGRGWTKAERVQEPNLL